jgi:hypothetical protein
MSLIDNFGKELIDPTIDLLVDYSEIGLDEIIQDEILKEVPLIKTVKSFMTVGAALKERSFAKKTLLFVQEFHKGDINETELAEFILRFDTEPKYRTKVLDAIVTFIESQYGNIKPIIMAKLFKAHLNKKLTWNTFLALNQCLDKLHTIGIKHFKRAAAIRYDTEILVGDTEDVIPYVLSAGLGTYNDSQFKLNRLGKSLYEYGIKDLKITDDGDKWY